ncbi:hypothetical protein D3C71_1806860 [compost metagenome]
MQDELQPVARVQPHGDAIVLPQPEAGRVPLDALDKVGHRRKDHQPQGRDLGFARMLEVVEISIDRR